ATHRMRSASSPDRASSSEGPTTTRFAVASMSTTYVRSPVDTPSPRRCPTVPAEDATVDAHDLAFTNQRRHVLLQERRVIASGDETDVLRVRLVGNGQAEPLGKATGHGLGHAPDRKERPGELTLTERVEHVGLVLRRIETRAEVP